MNHNITYYVTFKRTNPTTQPWIITSLRESWVLYVLCIGFHVTLCYPDSLTRYPYLRAFHPPVLAGVPLCGSYGRDHTGVMSAYIYIVPNEQNRTKANKTIIFLK